MDFYENYVYKAEINWSILTEGLTLPVENQVVFARNMGRFLQRGEAKDVTLYFNGTGYRAQIRNVKFNPRLNRKTDAIQIRYPKNGELSQALKACFFRSYNYIKTQRDNRPSNDRSMIKLPDGSKEYLAIYTTQYEDSYILEAIVADDILQLKKAVKNQSELLLETRFNYEFEDKSAGLLEDERLVKIRKLNRKIGDNLKLLYDYRCQICEKHVGEEYGARVVEAHHIEYFVESLNNGASNQLIVCPNHHSIIHEVNPIFVWKKLIFVYPNGLQEGLRLNKHL